MKKFLEYLLEQMSFSDAMKVFNIEVVPNKADLDKLYKKLALKNHPDLGGSEEKMKEINQAKDVLDKNVGKSLSKGSSSSVSRSKEDYNEEQKQYVNYCKAVEAELKTIDIKASQNYLETTYLNMLKERIQARAENQMKPDLDSAKSRLEEIAAGYLSDLGASEALPEGWFSTSEFEAMEGDRSDTLSVLSGASILWVSGTAVADQPLIDVTAALELPAGGVLVAGHRYVSVERTVVRVTSRSGAWATQGAWTTDSDGSQSAAVTFTDVPEGSWYADAVYYAVDHGLFNGTSETTFSPMMTMQRCMLTTVLYRQTGEPAVEYSAIFSDVPDGTWYSLGTVWAGQNGVVNGSGDGRFLPTDEVARQQIAVILFNYASFIGCDTGLRGDLSVFSDGSSVASWAKEAVSWAVAIGLLRGSDGKIMPGNSASRAEVAIMLQRFQDWADPA